MNIIDKFLKEKNITTRVKIENYLFVYLDLRPCSLTIIPSDFNNPNKIGRAMDQKLYNKVSKIPKVRDPVMKKRNIKEIKNDMRLTFQEIVHNSKEYKSHVNWAEIFDLYTYEVEWRPTIHNLYIFKKLKLQRIISNLIKERDNLRAQKNQNYTRTKNDIQLLLYPEEFSYKYLRTIGDLLGYPNCCVEQYISDRKNNKSVEKRASQQIKYLQKKIKIEIFSYYIRNFFPCSPICKEAYMKGKKFYKELDKINKIIGSLYLKCMKKNFRNILYQPEIIQESISKIIKEYKYAEKINI